MPTAQAKTCVSGMQAKAWLKPVPPGSRPRPALRYTGRSEVVMSRRLRSLLFVLFTIVLCSVLGGIFGPGVAGVSAASSSGPEDLKASIKQFTKVYNLV